MNKLCVLLACLVSIPPSNAGADAPQRRRVKANTVEQVHRTKVALYRRAGAKRLRDLMASQNDVVALEAAFERFRRTLPKRVNSQSFKPKSPPVQRLIGFIEGRLPVSLPTWWEDAMLSVEATVEKGPEHYFWYPHPPNTLTRYLKTKSRYSAPKGVAVRQEKKNLAISIANHVGRVSLKTNPSAINYVNAKFLGGHYVVAPYGTRAWSYGIHCFDGSSRRQKWSATVWASGDRWSYEGRGYHEMTFAEHKGTLFVFGAADDVVYLEAFRLADGKNVFRFATSY